MDYDRLFGLVIGTASVILTVTAVICYCSSRPSPRYRRRRGVRMSQLLQTARHASI
jgi:hypothetical protein